MGLMSRRQFVAATVSTVGAGAIVPLQTAQAAEKTSGRPTETYDVVVVGAGLAGMCAALEASENGAKVILLEKMSSPQGNTIYAGGWICAVGSKFQKNHPEDTPETLYKDMMMVSGNKSDPTLLGIYAKNCGADIDWLASHGLNFVVWENLPAPTLSRMLSLEGNTRGGALLIRAMLKALEKAHIEVRYNTKAVELIKDECFNVHGVSCITETGRRDFLAKGGVIMTMGGYGSNNEMVTKYIGQWASHLVQRGSLCTTGDDILLAQSVMAKLVNLDQFYAGPITPTGSVNPNSIMQTGYGIQVNEDGKRFLQESWLQVPRAKAVAQLTHNNRSFMLVDAKTDENKNVLSRAVKRFARLNVHLPSGNTIAEVARSAGIPEENLVATVEEYNKAVKEGKTANLNPPYKIAKPHTLDKPPYYLIPVAGGICSTMGGIAINPLCEVINNENKPIRGLYAAGSSVGGIWYDDDLGGNQLGGCMVFGRIAGRNAAKRARSVAA